MPRHVADDIIAGLEDAIRIARGEAEPGSYRIHVPERIDVRAMGGRSAPGSA